MNVEDTTPTFHDTTRTEAGFLVDDDTGEILEWPAEWSDDRITRLAWEYRAAAEQENAWKATKGAYGAALNRMLAEANQKNFYVETGTVIGFPGRRSANIEALQKAHADELLTADEVETIILAAVQTLAPDRVNATLDWLITDQNRRMAIRERLITTGKTYVQVKAPKKQAPKVTKAKVKVD